MSKLKPAFPAAIRRRDSSSSTVKARRIHGEHKEQPILHVVQATLWVHDDQISPEDILIKESLTASSSIKDGDLIEVTATRSEHEQRGNAEEPKGQADSDAAFRELTPRLLCTARVMSTDPKGKQLNFDISLHSRKALSSGFRSRDLVEIRAVNLHDHTASHVELGFRDVYLARSDMWRMVGLELANNFVHVGQRISFLGSIRCVVKAIHVRGHRVSAAYFSGNTVPVFRSEAARYVIFIQMSREMWGFDSEGNGELLFNRVINGFLPDLFKRWTALAVRHLVSIVLFGRQEYTSFDLGSQGMGPRPLGTGSSNPKLYQDFYKVVVTDMASAQWTTILDELKKNFRAFLRDVSLFPPEHRVKIGQSSQELPKITGRLTAALKGNILEAINMASMQFSNDYVDRDLIRTGISVVVVTAGAGVFEVEKELLNLTSENLTNNGIGIDIVCLSKMPLHSVPCFKYKARSKDAGTAMDADTDSEPSSTPVRGSQIPAGLSAPGSYRGGSPVIHSLNSSSVHPFSRFSTSVPVEKTGFWSYGIPQWIDLSYWSPVGPRSHQIAMESSDKTVAMNKRKEPFVPRVRMYEIQMMGLTEMGMADISIPWMSETQEREPNRRRRKTHTQQSWTGSRSLSHSPKLSRRSLRPESASFKGQGILATGNRLLGDTFNKMDTYDERLFRTPSSKRRLASLSAPAVQRQRKLNIAKTVASQDTASEKRPDTPEQRPGNARAPITNADPLPPSKEPSLATLNKQRSPEAARAARNASYALRGLAPPMRATASTEINVENVRAQVQKAQPLKARPTIATTASTFRSISMQSAAPTTAVHTGQMLFGNELSPVSSNAGSDRPSTPIKISKPLRTTDGSYASVSSREKVASGQQNKTTTAKQSSKITMASSDSSSDIDSSESEAASNLLASSVPRSNLPFIRNVNASNPLKGNPNRESFFGRWQHLYPRKPRAATVKWRSLCTPASVPLTTEDFPPKDSLETDYDMREYVVSLADSDSGPEQLKPRDELLREMLSIRFAHGYQLVVGPRMNKFEGPGLHDASFFFSKDARRHDGQYLFMSMGITIQKLTLEETKRVRVARYQRKPLEAQQNLPQEVPFDSHVRTILSENFKKRTMNVSGYNEAYPWELADNYLANANGSSESIIQTLRFWRARFVLLPVEPPANAYRPTPADSEENDEEIHLRGIRALTQAWQKIRFVPPEDRRAAQNRLSSYKPKDRNPLRIGIETLNPSELVATELDKLLAAEEAGDVQTAQLLPEEEQFDRETAKLGKLAAVIQSDRGIEIKNRRWHLRLHYSCFNGEDLTNWLVQNVRDIDTRDEAVDFGNTLMKEGLFEHVNSRHNFKDGNFFYSIKPEWRASRTEVRQSWFPASRKSDKSTPATPALEQSSRESPSSTARMRATSNFAASLAPASSELSRSTPERKKLAVSLSKMIRLDVDIRKRSDRSEIVNLHYDRLHNPENCYHLELAWLNVTSKLVDDAIVSWTTIAERYGLKLVEVPIVEAHKIPETEPFRSAYRIKLAVAPPSQNPQMNGNGRSFFTATSFTPQHPPIDKHVFQKALLRHFNFVLDLEGLSEFPENVEINYSWGKLNYEYTQFVHRSGVILAQITPDGDIILLANRLYNSRLASAKDTSTKLEGVRQLTAGGVPIRPSAQSYGPTKDTLMQASGILGINVASPAVSSTSHALSSPSPMLRPLPRPLVPPIAAPNTARSSPTASAVNSTSSIPLASAAGARLDTSSIAPQTPLAKATLRAAHLAPLPSITTALASPGLSEPQPHLQQPQQYASADVFGPRRPGPNALSTFITPEQIKDDIEKFCSDPAALTTFYAETQALLAQAANAATSSAAPADGSSTPRQQALSSVPGTPVSGGVDRDMPSAERRERDKKRASIVATGSSLLRPVAEHDLEAVPVLGALSGIPEMRLNS